MAKYKKNPTVNIVSLITGALVKKGYKQKAEAIVKDTIARLKMQGEFKKSTKLYLRIAANKVRPNFELKSKKVAAMTIKLPAFLNEQRSRSFAIKWLITAADKRRKKTFGEALADEVLDAVKEQGGAYNKKLDTYKEVDQSRIYLRFLEK